MGEDGLGVAVCEEADVGDGWEVRGGIKEEGVDRVMEFGVVRGGDGEGGCGGDGRESGVAGDEGGERGGGEGGGVGEERVKEGVEGEGGEAVDEGGGEGSGGEGGGVGEGDAAGGGALWREIAII